MILRVIFVCILFALIFILPWWANVLLVVAGSFYFKNFYEAVVIAFLADSLYGSSVIFDDFVYFFTISALIMIFIINKIREKMIMY